MTKTPSNYIGNLYEKGRPDLNLATFGVVSTQDKADAISEMTRQAKEFMEIAPLAEATLAMTKNGKGFETIELENPRYFLGT